MSIVSQFLKLRENLKSDIWICMKNNCNESTGYLYIAKNNGDTIWLSKGMNFTCFTFFEFLNDTV